MRKILFYILMGIGTIFALIMTLFFAIADKVYDVKPASEERWW